MKKLLEQVLMLIFLLTLIMGMGLGVFYLIAGLITGVTGVFIGKIALITKGLLQVTIGSLVVLLLWALAEGK